MSAEAMHGIDLAPGLAVLAAAVIAVPLARLAGFGSIVAYLAAGVALGPWGLKVVTEPGAILPVAELGVVLFLFIIGLEMQPRRLWTMRRQIFGIGFAQVALCGVLLTAVGVYGGGLPPVAAFIAAMGFVMSSTAAVMQMLAEQGETSTARGQRIVSVLLFEDLAIVPLLAVVAALAPAHGDAAGAVPAWVSVSIGMAVIVGLVAFSRYLLNPLFARLSRVGAHEVLTAAALLVVLGAAYVLERIGLSAAMGAFLAGVMLSESTFRHELEADIEPFRGLLLGLFFITVGMSLDVPLVLAGWTSLLGWVLVFMLTKAVGVYVVARLRGDRAEALQRALLMAQGGEFAFVLFGAAASVGLIDAHRNALLTAAIILSMALTPVVFTLARPLLARMAQRPADLSGIDTPNGERSTVLVIGFGRFGQVASQALLARGIDVTIIDKDVEMIRSAESFGFKVYYGDATRLDVLRASGAATAAAIMACTDVAAETTKIVEQVKAEFPLVRICARSFDRSHTLALRRLDVDLEVRETFESAVVFGSLVLRELGVPPDEVADVEADIRARDAQRNDLLMAGDRAASIALMHGSGRMVATPLTPPRQQGRLLNQDDVDGDAA